MFAISWEFQMIYIFLEIFFQHNNLSQRQYKEREGEHTQRPRGDQHFIFPSCSRMPSDCSYIYPHLTSHACTLRWREDGHCCQCKRRPRAFCKVWACSSLRRQCRKAGAQLYRKISTPRSATEQASDLALGEPHFQSTGNDHDWCTYVLFFATICF